MKELEIQMIDELIALFNAFVIEGLTNNVKEKAKEIESKYLFTSPLVSDMITNINGKLTYFYAPISPGPITKKEAKEIVLNLRKRKQELEND